VYGTLRLQLLQIVSTNLKPFNSNRVKHKNNIFISLSYH